jgi:urease accessory protein
MTISANTLPSDKTAKGKAEVGFVHTDGRTRLKHLYQTTPLRVLFPNVLRGDIPVAALTTVSGGLVGGDEIEIDVHVGPDARAMVMAQAAEKVYRSNGPDCLIDVSLKVSAGGWLEWLPQEAIVFDGARLRRKLTLRAETGANFMAGEILIFGRTAMGEELQHGLLRDAWSVEIDGELRWMDALHLDGDLTQILKHPACFDGARACATAVVSNPGHLDLVRGLIGDDAVEAAATIVNDLLIVRWLALDAVALRRSFEKFWSGYRAAEGLPAQLPRLWHI